MLVQKYVTVKLTEEEYQQIKPYLERIRPLTNSTEHRESTLLGTTYPDTYPMQPSTMYAEYKDGTLIVHESGYESVEMPNQAVAQFT